LDKLSKRLSDILGDNKYLAELIIISDVIFNYENIHYPIIEDKKNKKGELI